MGAEQTRAGGRILMLCISMAHSAERRARMQARLEPLAPVLARHGIDFRFFDAVNGRALPEYQYQAIVTMGFLSGRALRPMQRGETGCVLSHATIWARMAFDDLADYDGVLILEDDADPVLGQFEPLLDRLLATRPDMAFMGGLSPTARRRTWGMPAEDHSHFLMFGPDYLYTYAYAYFLSPAGAKQVLDNFLRRPYLADDWASLLRGRNRIPYYYLFEHGDSNDSSLEQERESIGYREPRLRKNARKIWGDLGARVRVLLAGGRLQRLSDHIARQAGAPASRPTEEGTR